MPEVQDAVIKVLHTTCRRRTIALNRLNHDTRQLKPRLYEGVYAYFRGSADANVCCWPGGFL